MIKFKTLAFLLLLTTSVFSQNFRLGFQASPHITWLNSTNNGIDNNFFKPGLKYGLESDIFLAGFPRYTLNTGLFVANHTFSAHYLVAESFFINQATFDKAVDIRFKLNYLEIPLNIKLRTDQFYRTTFYGQFGLTNQINLSATAESGDNQLTGDNVSKHIRKYNLAMLMGAGAEYDIGGNTSLNFGIQYTNGLIDVTNIKDIDEKTVFNAARIVIGVMF